MKIPPRRDQRPLQTFLVILLVVAGCAHVRFGHLGRATQWDPAQRLTYGEGIAQLGYHFTKSVEIDEDNRIHVVWYDTRDGQPQIYYKRSMDWRTLKHLMDPTTLTRSKEGTVWGPDLRLSPYPAPQEQPAIAVTGSHVYVVWHDLRDGNAAVYFKRSLDTGRTWGADIRLSHGPADSMYPSIAVSKSHLHVTFADNRDGHVEVYYTRSKDGGLTWDPEIRLSGFPEDSWTPSVVASGSAAYVAWTDTRDGSEEEYFKESTDEGATWGADMRLTNDLANSWAPVIAVSKKTVHYVWFTQKDNRIQPRDVEHKLDEIMVLMMLPVEPEPTGVVLLMSPRNAKERIQVKLRKIREATPAWVEQGGDLSKLQRILREFEQLGKPEERLEAKKPLDKTKSLVGPPVQSTPVGTGIGDLDMLQARLQEEIQRVDAAVPLWVRRSGEVKGLTLQPRIQPSVFDTIGATSRPSWEEKERKLDEAMQLLGVSLDLQKDMVRVYYLDALQDRIREKMQQVQAAIPAWVQRGGDPKQLEAILNEVERMLKTATTAWQLYYKRSIDGGMTWEPEIRLTSIGEYARRPDIAVVGDEVHVAWFDMREGGEGIYYIHSPNGGRSWGPETYLVSVNGDWVHPSIAASRDFVYLLWPDQHEGQPKIYYRRKVNSRWTPNYGE